MFFQTLLKTKENILKNVGNQLTVAIDFNSFFSYYESQWLLPTVLNTQVWNNMKVRNDDKMFG